jgi:hypothetical protein
MKQRIVMVASCSKSGEPNASLKGIVDVEADKGIIYFLDLYAEKTKENLAGNAQVSISAADIDGFVGYQFKGQAEIIEKDELFEKYKEKWEKQRTNLLIERMVKNIQKGSSHGRHELYLPEPKYLVKVTVKEIYDLLPKGEERIQERKEHEKKEKPFNKMRKLFRKKSNERD